MAEVQILPVFGDNYCYLIEYGAGAVAVDPGDASAVSEALQKAGKGLAAIVNTHHHYDHTAGNKRLKEVAVCEVIGPKDSPIPVMDRGVADGDILTFGSIELQVLATPGHTRSSVSYFMPASAENEQPMLWTGDTLFVGGCGRILECGPETMWDSLCKLATLPKETLVYCGHEYAVENYEFASMVEPGNEAVERRLSQVKQMLSSSGAAVVSTIGDEVATNPFLRSDTRQMRDALGMSSASAVEIFAELRWRKDIF